MITQFKLFEATTYPFEKVKGNNITYTFKNKNGTKYIVKFQDGQMYYQTDVMGMGETNEFDLINVFTTLAAIVYDYLQNYDNEVFIENILSKKETDRILRKVDNHKGKALSISRTITNSRTENMLIYLKKILPKEYKIEIPFTIDVNIIHVYLEGTSQTFESISSEPKINDYVICKDTYIDDFILDDFLGSNIGIILLIDPEHPEHPAFPYTVQYENIPENIQQYFSITSSFLGESPNSTRKFNRNEIVHFSEDKSDIQRILTQKRFDL